MSNDTEFTAYGAYTWGFHTDPNADEDGGPIRFGANVQGDNCGVYGESLSSRRSLGDRTAKDGTGVHGVGELFGVYGISGDISPNNNNGFDDRPGFGSHPTGVVGVSLHGPGVVGTSEIIASDSADSTRIFEVTDATNGVVGISKSKTGVVGLHYGGITTQLPQDALDGLTGSGVYGLSNNGAGIRGFSESDRGGVFVTGHEAQLQLTPLRVPRNPAQGPPPPRTEFIPLLPKDGKAGDLFAAEDLSNVGELCQLWFCVRSANGGNPAQWRQVTLGPVVIPGRS